MYFFLTTLSCWYFHRQLIFRKIYQTFNPFTRLFAEASPNKKRKIEKEEPSEKETEEKKPEESHKEEESKASCSKEKDVCVTSEDSASSSAEVDWVDRLHTTVVSLISTLQQKTAREEST